MENWGLDPTYFGHRKLLCAQFSEIVSTSCKSYLEHYYYGRPVSRVEVVGIVVDILWQKNKIVLTIDDGTGLIRCFKYINTSLVETSDPLKFADIGAVVIVQGTLQSIETNEFAYALTVKVNNLFTSPDPNMEMYHWTACMLLDEEEYSRASNVPELDEETNDGEASAGSGSESGLEPKCICKGLSGDNNVKVALPSVDARSGLRVKEELLYCPCASSKASLDPSGAFQVNLLFYILSTMEDHILSETEVLEDTAVRALAAAHLTDYLNCNVGGSHASAFLDLQRHEGTHVPSENNHVSTLILETLACFARDGVVAPLSGKHKRGSHQLITRDFLRTALQSCIVSIIQQKRKFIGGDEAISSKVTREEFDGELRDDPQLAPDAIDELRRNVRSIPKWRIQRIYNLYFNKV